MVYVLLILIAANVGYVPAEKLVKFCLYGGAAVLLTSIFWVPLLFMILGAAGVIG